MDSIGRVVPAFDHGESWVTPRLTTHVLDTARGRPACGIPVFLSSAGPASRLLCEAITNEDGRCDAPLLEGAALVPGRYELLFLAGAYLRRHAPGLPEPAFLDEVVLRFGLAHPDRHYHVPLLLSPFGYTTYLGS